MNNTKFNLLNYFTTNHKNQIETITKIPTKEDDIQLYNSLISNSTKSKMSVYLKLLGFNPFLTKINKREITLDIQLKKQQFESTKEYLFHYNRSLAKEQEKLIMNSIFENNREITINDKISRIYYLFDIPDFFAYNYILQILNCGLPINLNYYIKATSRTTYLAMLRTRRAILQSKQFERQARGSDNDPHIEKEALEVDHLINDMVSGGQKTFLVSIYATITADTIEKLNDYCYTFDNLTKQLEILFYTRTFQQKDSLPAILPLANDTIKEKLNLQTQAVVEMLPFLAKNIQDNSGFYLGTSRTNINSMIIFDPFKARNANILILGTSGSGKSVTSKSLLLKLVMRQVQCIIIDPEGEYLSITNHCGGKNISFGQGRGLNIFDLEFVSEESRRNHIAVLKNFFRFIIDDSKYSDSKLDLILTKLYNQKPSSKVVESKINDKIKNIKIKNIINDQLSKPTATTTKKRMTKKVAPNPISMEQFIAIARADKVDFLEDLLKLTEGSLAGIFDSNDKLDFDSEVINFDLSNLGNDQLKLPVMYLVASIIDNLIDRADKKRMIFIDEAHLFLNRQFTREFYIRLQKTARKRQSGVVSITQNAEDYRDEGGSKTILTQAETVILLKQHTASINFLRQMQIFDLSEDEYNELYSLERGEAILFREQEHIYLYIEPFESEWEFIGT